MIPSPYRFDPELTDQEYAKLGVLSLRWSTTEHILGNCLRILLRLSMEEAVVVVFPMNLEQRINRIDELSAITPMNSKAQATFNELKYIMKGIQYVRNNVIHAIVEEHDTEGHVFHLRSKGRSLTKAEVFSAEELTNYAAHLVLTFRYALGFKDDPSSVERTSPGRPAIPEFLRSVIQFPKEKGTAGR
jgi:hypothetical protein